MVSTEEGGRLGRLERTVEQGFKELKEMMGGLDQRLRMIETSESSCRVGQDFRMKACETDLAEAQGRLVVLEGQVKELLPWMRGLRWAVGILGAAVAALLWSLLTGQATLIIK